MIQTTEVSITYKGDGVQTSFPYPYPYRNSDDIVGYIINDLGYEKRITNNFKYDKVSNIYQYPLAGDPLAEPYSIKLIRETPQQQNADLPGKLPFSLIEKSLDWIIMILQEIGSRCNSLWHIRNDCKLSETNARNSASAAAESEENAANSEDMAKKWAMSPASPDGVVDTDSPTGYTQSAKIWAALSKEYAGLSKFKLPIGYYNSVDEMRASETAIVGRPCVTLGYYEPNDGGGGVYIIRQKKENDVDDGGSVLFLDNGNVAELIIDKAVNVKQFGAKGDGVSDDVLPIQTCIDWACINKVEVHIPQGTYSISNALYVYQWQHIVGNGKNQTYIKRTTDSVDPKHGVSAIIILERTENYRFAYTEGQNISNMAISSDKLIDYGIYAGIACPYTNINNISINMVKNGIVYKEGTWVAEISYIEILSPEIGIKIMSDSTSLHLKNTYVMTPSKIGYYTAALSYSSWEDIACDWATNDAICYEFHYSNINISGLGAESEKAKNIITVYDNSNISIHAGTLYGLTTDDKREMIIIGDGSLSLDSVNIGVNLKTPIVNNICFKGRYAAYFDIKNCTISKYIKNVYDKGNDVNNTIQWDNGHTTDNRYVIGEKFRSRQIREGFSLMGNIGGTPYKTLTGRDSSWYDAPYIGDMFINQNPKNGIALFQAVTDFSPYQMQGKITNIAGNILTLDSLDLDDIANTRGIVISSTGFLSFDEINTEVKITAIDTNKKEITVADSSTFTVGDSPMYRANGVFVKDNTYRGVQQVLALSTANRITNPIAGTLVFDTTLNKPIWYNGRNWVDANGNNV